MEPGTYDLTARYGATLAVTIVLYADARMTRWRDDVYNEEWVYKVGDGTQNAAGEAFVAILETQGTEPGSEDGALFWSPLEPLDLTGHHVAFICDDVFELEGDTEPEVEAAGGRINVEAVPALFADAPSSAHWYLRDTDTGGTVSYPINGTMLFKQP